MPLRIKSCRVQRSPPDGSDPTPQIATRRATCGEAAPALLAHSGGRGGDWQAAHNSKEPDCELRAALSRTHHSAGNIGLAQRFGRLKPERLQHGSVW